jgi:hypothetical protein
MGTGTQASCCVEASLARGAAFATGFSNIEGVGSFRIAGFAISDLGGFRTFLN